MQKVVKQCGIYAWTNLLDNKRYVGYAKCIEDRRDVHISSLNGNYHINCHLQNAWNKYGQENFVFSILEICDISELCRKEYEWGTLLKVLDPKFGYNIQPFEPNGIATLSEETKRKISQSKIGKKRFFTDEWKKNLGDATRGRKTTRQFCSRYIKVIDTETNIIYSSIYDAARAFNIPPMTLKYRLKNPGTKHLTNPTHNLKLYTN